MDSLQTFSDDVLLMVNAMQTLDNLVSADEEYAAIVIEKGGQQVLQQIVADTTTTPQVHHRIVL